MTSTLEKRAFMGGVGAAAGRMLGRAGARVGGALGGRSGSLLGARMGKEMGRQAVGGAVLGGAVEGGLGAVQAGEGHRLEGFAQGASHGAAMGALGGAASGAVTAPMRGARLNLMQAGGATRAEASKALRAGYGQNLKNLVRGGGPGGRGAAAIETLGAPLTLAAEGIAAAKMTPTPEDPHQVRTATLAGPELAARDSEDRSGLRLEPIYATPLTSTTGAGLVDAGLDRLLGKDTKGLLAKDKFLRKRALPALGAAAVTIPAVRAIKALNPPEDSPEQAALKDIDVDALKYYFGKQPTAP